MSVAKVKIKQNSLTAWILAARPKTLMAGIIPIIVGSFIAPVDFAEIDWGIVFSALIASVALQIATNLINDALDFKKGADTKDRIGPLRVTQSGLLTSTQVLAGGFGFLLCALLFALPLIFKGGIPLLVIVILSAICSYLYTGGPYPLAYTGLGEAFVILFYGFVATCSTYYLQYGAITPDALVAGFQMGCLTTVLIAINNLRDINEDSKTGKNTLAVRFGLLFGRWEITALILVPFFVNAYWYLSGRYLPFILPMTALLIGINLIRGVWKHYPSKLYNRFLGEASLLLMIFGLLLVLGMRLS